MALAVSGLRYAAHALFAVGQPFDIIRVVVRCSWLCVPFVQEDYTPLISVCLVEESRIQCDAVLLPRRACSTRHQQWETAPSQPRV